LETGISAVLVTHDQVEAMSMSDRIAIMKDGKILQVASPNEMYQRPENDFIAGFLGNPPIAFLDGIISAGNVKISSGNIEFPCPENIEKHPDGSHISVGIRPEFYQPGNPYKIPGTVSFVEIQGRENLYDIKLKDGNLLRSIQSANVSPLSPGTKVDWGVIPEQLFFFDSLGKRL
jgi:inositol-phosphate transport system ATP-binding protein